MCIDSDVPASGKMINGIGAKKQQIGVGIGQLKKKNICIQNMFLCI
jgi:hypothetical protein